MEAERVADFDDVLGSVGAMGPAQIIILLYSVFIEASAGLAANFFVTEAGNPGYTCVPVNDSLSPTDPSIKPSYGNVTTNGCPAAGRDCINVTFSNEYTSAVTEWKLICDERYKARLTSSMYFAGLLIGGLVGGQLSDLFGRRPVLLPSWALVITSQSLLTLSPSWPVYVIIRTITGAFIGSCSGVASVLVIEYFSGKWRSFVGIRWGWRVAHMIFPLLAYLLRPWRHLSLGLSLPFIPLLITAVFFMPESARWLTQKRRYRDAHKWLSFVAKLNKKQPPDIEDLRRVGESEIKKAQENTTKFSFIDLFRTKKYATYTCVQLYGWFTIALVSITLKANISSLAGSIYLNLTIAGSVNLLVRLTAPLVMNFFGRRVTYPVYALVPIISAFIILALDVSGRMIGRESIRTGLALTSYGFSTGNWCLLFVYTAELYPTLMRTLGIGSGNMAARIAGVVAPQILLLSDYHKSIPYVLMGTFSIIACVLMVTLLPETKGKPLPEDLPRKKERTQKQTDEDKHEQIELSSG